MKNCIDHFKDSDIIFYLSKMRVNYAKKRNKKHLLNNLTNKEHHVKHENNLRQFDLDLIEELDLLMPPRRLWVTLGKESRFTTQDGIRIKLNTVDRNIECLVRTIKHYRKKDPNQPFIKRLNVFISEIKALLNDENYKISSPDIYPNPKKVVKNLSAGQHNECRPIARFGLKDRLILSFTNKFLTKLFDCYFEDCSLAFRAVKKEGEKKTITNHHTAVQKILKYKTEKYKTTPLYVAECDMKKFYDTVNHKIILTCFNDLIAKAKVEEPNIDLSLPIRIFNAYLGCYSFEKNILELNNDSSYWEKYKIPSGKFGWVEKEIESSAYYQKNSDDRIGVPQGGALSGLIANIVLDKADKALINIPELFYSRYCDDMIIFHSEKETCTEAIALYRKIIHDQNLFAHNAEENLIKERERKVNNKVSIGKKKEKVNKYYTNTLSNFWKAKSKGPYLWDEFKNNGFPWIGFVGYEVHHSGDVRVRKSSMEKEKLKQEKVIKEILNAIRKSKRAKNGTIQNSAINRLIGMSVGRLSMHNYETVQNEMCWKKGFKELNYNKHSVKQLKQLDNNRNGLYSYLLKRLGKEEKKNGAKDIKINEIVSYRKPFSYYYQVIERKK